MRGLRTLRSLVRYSVRDAQNCSNLFDWYYRERLRSVSSARTRIPTQHLRPEYHSLSHLMSLETPFPQPLGISSRSTWPTSNTHFRIVAISLDGSHRASFCGTRSQLADQVNLFLMTGREKSGHLSQKRSLESFQEEVSYFASLVQLLKDI